MEVRRLQGNGDDSSDDDCSQSKEQNKSDIEWQSGVPQEGVLINIDTSSEEKPKSTPKAYDSSDVRDTNGVEEGKLIDDVELNSSSVSETQNVSSEEISTRGAKTPSSSNVSGKGNLATVFQREMTLTYLSFLDLYTAMLC